MGGRGMYPGTYVIHNEDKVVCPLPPKARTLCLLLSVWCSWYVTFEHGFGENRLRDKLRSKATAFLFSLFR